MTQSRCVDISVLRVVYPLACSWLRPRCFAIFILSNVTRIGSSATRAQLHGQWWTRMGRRFIIVMIVLEYFT